MLSSGLRDDKKTAKYGNMFPIAVFILIGGGFLGMYINFYEVHPQTV
jgi:hypothetical protein